MNEYKYLGTKINRKCDFSARLDYINRKINYIIYQLKPIILRENFRLNSNLFRTMVMPLFRMGFILFEHLQDSQKNKFEIAIRKAFKKMNMLPQSTPTTIIYKIIGNI